MLKVHLALTVTVLSTQTIASAQIGPQGTPAKRAAAPAPPASTTTATTEGIPWRSGRTQLTLQSEAQRLTALQTLAGQTAEPAHFLLRFDRPLQTSERNDLEAAGLTLLSFVGDHSYFASAAAPTLDAARVAQQPLVAVQPIERAWKLHPMLERDEVPTWAAVDHKQGDVPTVGTYVMFHPDVDLETEALAAMNRHFALVRDVVESVNAFVVELPFDRIKPLAAEDVVQYIEPAMPRLGTTNDSNRIITEVDTVQAAPYSLDGTGVSVMVYDGGTARDSHVDFSGRLFVRDGDSLSDHATHVSGTVGGDGSASGGANRGMAPNVTIQSYGFEYDGSGTFLYTNPGDFEVDYADAINNWGAAVSNNSIGTNTEPNGFDCSFQGDYGLMSSLIDAVARGSVSGGVPHRIVWAAGNERQGDRCDIEGFGDYYSCAPPAGAKNHLSIGALNSNDDSMTTFSSWGPTDDGRLKPDFSAPGCQSNADGGVTSASSFGSTSYGVKCGTSMASPTVTGIVALMLQDYRAQYGGPDPRNSTLKVLLAHTAVDIGNAGPDYQAGYGSVRAPAVIDFMRSGNFVESVASQSDVLLYTVSVTAGDPELRVTLAWDDVPGTPNVTDALVNDLDLHVFSPSGVEHFPWTLDPLNPAAPAAQNARDRLNNLEQVYAASPEAGAWRIEIRGFDVPQGPQEFSLAASPTLVNCASQGILALGAANYNCSSGADVLVIDCDLDTNDMVAETISVLVTSSSEPAGELVTLTETGPATAAFAGMLPLDEVDAAGVLQIVEGDTVQASYFDADDGNGGSGTVFANAMIDCTAPAVSNVAVSGVTHSSATITFDVDEPSAAVVTYGTACGGFTEVAASPQPLMSHSIVVNGLDDAEDYFFHVTVNDTAQNVTIDTNGGACYDFTTADVPDYFTEQFGPFDMNGRTVLYTPGGPDGYTVCSMPYNLSVFPTDPAGGAVLPLSDDDSEVVNIAGGNTVALYGTTYSSFYVGSNGYITFTGTDTDYTESLSDHFDTERLSLNFDDYNPASAGQVTWLQMTDRMVVTYDGVPEYSTSNQNFFQAELYFDGRIRVTYLDVASTDGIAGLSQGNGVPTPLIPSDFSSDYACPQGDPFGPTDEVPRDGGTRQL